MESASTVGSHPAQETFPELRALVAALICVTSRGWQDTNQVTQLTRQQQPTNQLRRQSQKLEQKPLNGISFATPFNANAMENA